MNIFYLDHDVKQCAEMHNDKHVVKMILEYAQLLSTAHRVIDGTLVDGYSKTGRKQKRYVLSDHRDSTLYSATHLNHPSALWVRKGATQYRWLHNLLVELCKEYTYRYGKVHKVEREGLLAELAMVPNKIHHDVFWSEPTPAMPDEVKIPGDSIKSYRNDYINNKVRLASWRKRQVPEWFNANI